MLRKDEIIVSLVLVVASACVGVALILMSDFFFGTHLLLHPKGDGLVEESVRPFQKRDLGWYELKRNYSGETHWGKYAYEVKTDQYGFRTDPQGTKTGKADLLFLGDSMTYGISGAWEDTFVGMYDRSTARRILNAGCFSYSPTPYLYQYKKALREGALKPGHVVVVALDISDIQDEAGIWLDGQEHPVKRKDIRSFLDTLGDSVRFGTAKYWFLDRFVNRPDPDWIYNRPRSAFTWDDWHSLDATLPERGYAPLGVAGGLLRTGQKLAEIGALARQNDARLFILIYPWPGQIRHEQKFSWTEYVNGLCRQIACAGVIDAQPAVQSYAAAHRNWYEDLYVVGDIHFNRAGNELVYAAIKRADPLGAEIPAN